MKDSPIKSVADLKGKVLATNAFGGETDMAIKLMLQKHNLAVNRDFTETSRPRHNSREKRGLSRRCGGRVIPQK